MKIILTGKIIDSDTKEAKKIVDFFEKIMKDFESCLDLSKEKDLTSKNILSKLQSSVPDDIFITKNNYNSAANMLILFSDRKIEVMKDDEKERVSFEMLDQKEESGFSVIKIKSDETYYVTGDTSNLKSLSEGVALIDQIRNAIDETRTKEKEVTVYFPGFWENFKSLMVSYQKKGTCIIDIKILIKGKEDNVWKGVSECCVHEAEMEEFIENIRYGRVPSSSSPSFISDYVFNCFGFTID